MKNVLMMLRNLQVNCMSLLVAHACFLIFACAVPEQVFAQNIGSTVGTSVSASATSEGSSRTDSATGSMTSNGSGKRKSKKARVSVIPHVSEPVLFAVPVSELNVKSKLVEMTEPNPSAFEFSVSSWNPSSFSRPTYLGESKDFQSATYPWISFSRIFPMWKVVDGSGFYSVLGLATANLEREGTMNLAGGAKSTAVQSLSLYMARLGFEYRGPRLLTSELRPVAGLSALPTLAISAQSELERSVNKYGLPFELLAGLQYRPKYLADFFGLGQASFGLAAQQVLGSVDGSKLNGLAAAGSVRIEM